MERENAKCKVQNWCFTIGDRNNVRLKLFETGEHSSPLRVCVWGGTISDKYIVQLWRSLRADMEIRPYEIRKNIVWLEQ